MLVHARRLAVSVLLIGGLVSPAAAQEVCVQGVAGIGFAGKAIVKNPGEPVSLLLDNRPMGGLYPFRVENWDDPNVLRVVLGQRNCYRVPAGESRNVFIIDRWDMAPQASVGTYGMGQLTDPWYAVLKLTPEMSRAQCLDPPHRCRGTLLSSAPGGLGKIGRQGADGYAVCDTGPIPAGQARTVTVWGPLGRASCTVEAR